MVKAVEYIHKLCFKSLYLQPREMHENKIARSVTRDSLLLADKLVAIQP